MDEKTYEIGLVMAGAVSAGAYTGGVIDFLQEALQQYQKVRKKFAEEHEGKELHNVQIRLMSGASAGGMCGTMMLSSMMDENYVPLVNFDPETITRSEINNNVFYRCWVDTEQGIDIKYFLETDDIQKDKSLKALLNCNRLEEIAEQALAHPRELQTQRGYIPEKIDHFLSVFNLNGIPYSMNFENSSSGYEMMNHSDMMHFVVDETITKAKLNEIVLPYTNESTLQGHWTQLKTATLATGAFPIALEPRVLTKSKIAYNEWKWWIPQTTDCMEHGKCFLLQNIKTHFEEDIPYNFVTVDGGTANNEPLEVARRKLASERNFNPRDKDEADRSIIMVDPFPAFTCNTKFSLQGSTLVDVALKLIGSLKDQARFKPDELEVARNPEIFSRYLIAPSRSGAQVGEELACSSLGAFGGFFSEKFRQHDFQLGRKNCQSFLMQHFNIGIKNSLVEDNLQWFIDHGCVIKDQYVQIIPMVNLPEHEITKPIQPISWQSVKIIEQNLEPIYAKMKLRIDAIVTNSTYIDAVISDIIKGIKIGVLKWIAKKILTFLKNRVKTVLVNKLTGFVQNKIESDFKARGLLQ